MKLKHALRTLAGCLALALLAVYMAIPTDAEAAGSTTCATCSNYTPARTVILVHGRNDTSARWNTLVTSWSSKGFTENTNLFRIDLATYCGDSGFCSKLASHSSDSTYVNESYARCLKDYIDAKVPCSATCPDVDIVTHSQGGITARYYERFLASVSPSRAVKHMVLMAPPNNGTNNCTLAGSCTGINPEDCGGSAFQHKLNGVAAEGDGSNDMTPNYSAVKYSATGSTGDNTVVPSPCVSWFITAPQTINATNISCGKNPNWTMDADSDRCQLSNVQHLVIPTNTTATNDAYCKLNL